MLVPAAHAPLYGVLSSAHTGTWASATVVWRPPNTTVAFSRSTSSRAMVTPLAGLPSSSRITISSLRPPRTPPLAFTSSMAIWIPRLIASPEAAEPPETAAASPILMGSLDWAPTPATSVASARVEPASTARNGRVRRRIEGLLEGVAAGLTGRQRRWCGSGGTFGITNRRPPLDQGPHVGRGLREEGVDQRAAFARADDAVGVGGLELV